MIRKVQALLAGMPPREKVTLICSGMVLLALTLFTTVGFTAWETSGLAAAHRAADSRVKRAEKLGVIFDSAKFSQSIRVPDNQNAAFTIGLQLFLLDKTYREGELAQLTSEYRKPTEMSDIARSLRNEIFESRIKEIVDKLDRPYFLPNTDWSNPGEESSPIDEHLLHNFSRILCDRARFFARNGNPTRALDDLHSAIRANEIANAIPIRWVAGCEKTMLRHGMDASIAFLTAFPGEAEQLRRVWAQMKLSPVGSSWRTHLYVKVHHDRNVDTTWFDALPWRDQNSSERLSPSRPWLTHGLSDHPLKQAMISRALERWIPVIQETDPAGNPINAARFDQAIKQFDEVGLLPQREPLDRLLTEFGLRSGINSHDQNRTTLAMMDTMCRAVTFHERVGRWPNTLSELGIALRDPFNMGRPLRYSRGAKEIRIWSVGTDRVDDGGVSSSEARWSENEKRRGQDDVLILPIR